MSTYNEVATKLADQWIDAVEKARASLPTEEAFKMPASFEMPDLSKMMPGNVIDGLPDAREVVETNFQIAQRLLAAQRDFTIAMIEKSIPGK